MSTTTPTTAEPLLSADEFMRLHGSETRIELFRGRVVRYPMPGGPHGYIISRVNAILFNFAEANNLGRTFANDTFVRVRLNEKTETLRGADVAYLSYAKLPPGNVPEGPLPATPELVVEVRSPSDRIPQLSAKATEYLEAGVAVVLVIDPDTESVAVFRENELPIRLHDSDKLTFPDILPGFEVQVSKFFRR